MKGYKGFNPDFKCNDKRYAVNTEYEEKGGEICGAGVMHFCETPLDVLDYYPILDDNCNFNRFAEVTALDKVQAKDNKRATKKIKIGAEFSFKDFIKAAVNVHIERASKEEAASGYSSKLAASGDYSKLAASGDYSKLAASGYSSQLAASGDSSQLAASGDSSKLAASGDSSQLAASGYYSVVAGIGINNIAKCALDGFIVLAEWKYNGNNWIPVNVKAAKVDGKTIKPDTWYKLENGNFVEVK